MLSSRIQKRCRLVRALLAIVQTVIVVLVFAHPLVAQGVDYVKAHYTKREYQVPMRDGARRHNSRSAPLRGATVRCAMCPYS